MGIWGPDEGQADLVQMSEKIFGYKEDKKRLELELSEVLLRYQYISKRKNLVIHEVIVLALVIAVCMTAIFLTLGDIFWMFFDWMVFLFCLYLLRREVKLLYLLFTSRNTEAALRFAQKHDLDTFQKQKRETENKITFLKSQIADLEQKIADLSTKRNALLEEKERREEILREKGILYDEMPGQAASKFTLKKESTGSQDIREVYEYYRKEEIYLTQHQIRLEGELGRIDKQIRGIDERFGEVRSKIILSLAVFVVLILFQQILSGALGTLYGLVCCAFCLFYLFYMEKTCKIPILNYLLEHDSPLIAEYAFCNGMVPVKNKRDDVLEQMDQCTKELEAIRTQMDALEFDKNGDES